MNEEEQPEFVYAQALNPLLKECIKAKTHLNMNLIINFLPATFSYLSNICEICSKM